MSRIQEFDASVDLLKFIFWQYDQPSDENIAKLVDQKNDEIKRIHADFWDSWYNDVFNIDTLNEFGVTVWSIILDIPDLITSQVATPNQSWGFGSKRKNYNNGNFSQSAGGVILTLDQKRRILRLKYLKVTSNGSISSINNAMKIGWGDFGMSRCIDNLDMTITFNFDFIPEPWIDYAINTLDILPRPSAVGFNIEINPPVPSGFTFGGAMFNETPFGGDSP